MTVREPPRLLPDLWKWTLASGVLAVILGVCVLVWPGISILVAASLFGVCLLITGIAQSFSRSPWTCPRAAGSCCSSAAPHR